MLMYLLHGILFCFSGRQFVPCRRICSYKLNGKPVVLKQSATHKIHFTIIQLSCESQREDAIAKAYHRARFCGAVGVSPRGNTRTNWIGNGDKHNAYQYYPTVIVAVEAFRGSIWWVGPWSWPTVRTIEFAPSAHRSAGHQSYTVR